MTPRYVVRRVVQVLPSLATIVVATFALVHAAPGDPIVALAGEAGDEAYYEFMREKYGLDRPVPQQFLTYAGNLVQGDLGVSFTQGRSVATVVAERLPATLLLMVTALALSTAAGIALGLLSAWRPFGRLDLAVNTAALVGYATPAFWLAQLALLLLAFEAGLFPIQGMTDARDPSRGFGHVLDVAHHLTLPALVLAVSELALVARLTRTGLLRELGSGYVRTAHSKGVGSGDALVRHALPNALLPVVTVIGTRLGMLFSGAVLVEIVFAWPGLGRLLLTATQTRDYPVLLGLVLLVAVSVVVVNLVTDLAYAWIDPRIRYE
ncbi:MAG TPA: ABC transporter permease [Acidimicrobiales bacterium]|nr:ABC transporter permease [Acidimicrobiales bacterium]